jgi:hypothetical protein
VKISTTENLPDWLRGSIDSPPKAGTGVHAWIFRVARQLHSHLPATEIMRLLESRLRDCGRHVPRSEIVAAVQNSLGCAWTPRGQGRFQFAVPQSKWPSVNRQRVRELTADGPGLCDLWEASPIRIEDNAQHTEQIIDASFPAGALLCCGKSQSEFATRTREAWRGQLAGLQFLVPSPMTAPTGQTRDGRESAHTLSNTAARRFLIVEFDHGSVDQQAALLVHLKTHAPLVCALHSGGKSLHAWFYCAGVSEDKILRFFRYAVSLGADSRLWTRSQFCRMPDGTRDNGRRQPVYYFDPKPIL